MIMFLKLAGSKIIESLRKILKQYILRKVSGHGFATSFTWNFLKSKGVGISRKTMNSFVLLLFFHSQRIQPIKGNGMSAL